MKGLKKCCKQKAQPIDAIAKMMTFVVVLLVAIPSCTQDQPRWQDITTVEETYEAFPDHMQTLMRNLNLDHPGMDGVKAAFEQGNIEQACSELLTYYRQCDNAGHLRSEPPKVTAKTDALADTILNDVFVVQNVRGKVPYGADGHRDWYYKGPNNDREWAWLSNRHSQINYVLTVFFETGNPKYVEYIDLFLRDFIIKSMPYPAEKGSESIWRGLEVAARAKVWSRIFYSLINTDYLSPSTKLLMLSSLPDHAHYNRNFHGGNNWLTMEISALATVAANFPEYKQSEEWLAYSIETIVESMKGQVYADGVQTELTSHYHNVAMRNFELFKNICDQANEPLPDFFNETIEDMYSYIAHVVRPDGNRILNNDGDKGSDRELILHGAEIYNHPEWEYIATNGTSGTKPDDGPSYFYPWAGQLISRSGFDADAHWSFFDVGPWGSGHQHNDKLHLSISAYGRDILVDAGRFAYTGEVAEKFRGYARGTQGHNTILIDGKGQQPDVRVIDEPLGDIHWKIAPEFDYAWNSFDQYIDIENVSHTRTLLYARGDFWVVVDRVTTDRPRTIQALWHWHPDAQVEVGEKTISTVNGKGNLQLVPVGNTKWKIEQVSGQETPEIQGWYSVEYNKFEPNLATIYSTKVESDQTFVWLLAPFESRSREIEVMISSSDSRGVSLSISEKQKGEWEIFVPYADSNEVKLAFDAK